MGITIPRDAVAAYHDGHQQENLREDLSTAQKPEPDLSPVLEAQFRRHNSLLSFRYEFFPRRNHQRPVLFCIHGLPFIPPLKSPAQTPRQLVVMQRGAAQGHRGQFAFGTTNLQASLPTANKISNPPRSIWRVQDIVY